MRFRKTYQTEDVAFEAGFDGPLKVGVDQTEKRVKTSWQRVQS